MQVGSELRLSQIQGHIQESEHSLHDSVEHDVPLRNVPFGHFFNSHSTWDIAKTVTYFTVSSTASALQVATSALFEQISETVQKVYTVAITLFLHLARADTTAQIAAGAVSFFIKDSGFDEKLATLRYELKRKTGTNHYAEFEKVIAAFAVAAVSNDLERALEFDTLAVPKWVKKAVLTQEGTYGFTGKTLLLLLQKHKALFEKIVSCTVLTMLDNLTDAIQKAQSENTHALLDLILSILQEVPAHFYECQCREAAMALPNYDESDPAALEAKMDEFFKTVSAGIIELLFTRGAKDITLPVSPTLASYLSVFALDSLKNKTLPKLIAKGFNELSETYVKNGILAKLFQEMHQAIDIEHELIDKPLIDSNYERIGELATAIHECIRCFLEYTDPTFLPWFVSTVVPYKIASSIALEVSGELEAKTVQEVARALIEALLVTINPGGQWVELDGEAHFQLAPFSFVVTASEFDEVEQNKNRKRAAHVIEIDHYIDTIGRDPKGLIQLMKNKLFAIGSNQSSDQVVAAEAAAAPVSMLATLSDTVSRQVQAGYEAASHRFVLGTLWAANVSRRIKNVNIAIKEKMVHPAHELLCLDVVRLVLTFFNKKLVFPDLRDIRFTKDKETTY